MKEEKGQLLYGVKVDFKETKILADLSLIFQDLGFTGVPPKILRLKKF